MTTRTESYEAPKRRKSDTLVTKERMIWRCDYDDSELELWHRPRSGARVPRGSAAFGGGVRHLMLRRGARRSGGVIAALLRNKQAKKDNTAKQQRSRNITASTLVASQHAGRQLTISPAFSRVSTGDADEAIAVFFFFFSAPTSRT